MLERIMALSGRDVFYAACMAYVVFYVVRSISKMFGGNREKEFFVKNLDVVQVYEKCKELFPIQIVIFDGKEFSRGMKVKITTMQHKVIEGELIGMNHVNLVCIRANNQIIAHQLEKVIEIVGME